MLLAVVLMVCQVALGHAADQAAEVLVAFRFFFYLFGVEQFVEVCRCVVGVFC
jgi:hypothetical protein